VSTEPQPKYGLYLSSRIIGIKAELCSCVLKRGHNSDSDQHTNRKVTDGRSSACAALRGKVTETPVKNRGKTEREVETVNARRRGALALAEEKRNRWR
jgi:hypothetical protein